MNFRLDRLATLYLASPYRRLMSRSEQCIPILMYHCVSEDEQSNVHPYYRTNTSPAMFAVQLRSLKTHGYTSCTLAQAVRQLESELRAQLEAKPESKTSTAAKSVVLTFDDGFRNFYREAFPLLSEYGFSATMFLPTAYIGDAPISFKGEDCLTWAEVRELKQHGIDFGSHTVTHPRLRELSASAINDELVNSKHTLEQKLGCPADSFAYPYAFPQTDKDFTQMLRNLLQAAGYKHGVSTIVGRANRRSEPLFLERLPVNSCDDNALFEAKLEGAYDWIATSQHISKALKSRLRHPLGRPNLQISNDLPLRTQPHS
ncbi:MAG: polysaccharide deacetylase family protein [Candidatus Sulfotelmatobacter sp.]